MAGTACAVALAATGAEVTLYEAQEDPAGPVGSFLSLAANGLRGLDVLGALDAVRAAGFAVPRQRMWAGNGKLLGDVARARHGPGPDDQRHADAVRPGVGAAGAGPPGRGAHRHRASG